MIFQNTIQELKENIKKAKKVPIISMAELRIAEKLSKEVEELINNWNVEPCCLGIMQDELIRELNKL